MNPPVESVASTPVPFDGGLQWRSAVGITSSISAQSPLSPVDQSLSLKNAPTALSEVSGKIVKILVEDGTPVEYGQPIFLVDPS